MCVRVELQNSVLTISCCIFIISPFKRAFEILLSFSFAAALTAQQTVFL